MFNYKRRTTIDIQIGGVNLGSRYPIRLQTMTNTDTNDIKQSVDQIKRVIDAGSELVRCTTQGKKEIANLLVIKNLLREQNLDIPIVADIHFNPDVAIAAAAIVEKVRINPGNFVKSKTDRIYTDEEYDAEKAQILKRLRPLIDVCKQNNTAIRIGVNHGSLSPRIVGRYGDTPEGLAQSCIEFLEMFEQHNFSNVVVSIKASNPIVMLYAVRILVAKMGEREMLYPIHLGVTEAGSGEDGRIKSAVGIGSLLAEGIGDTIRVSLSEEPENEIPVAKTLVEHIGGIANHQKIDAEYYRLFDKFAYNRRETTAVGTVGGNYPPIVLAKQSGEFDQKPDFIMDRDVLNLQPISLPTLTLHRIEKLKLQPEKILLLYSENRNIAGEMNAFFHKLMIEGIKNPVVISAQYSEQSFEALQIKAATDIGSIITNGFGDGILITNNNSAISDNQLNNLSFDILQATRTRLTKNDYIACPGCGRTLFDLQSTLEKVREATSHIKNLKIAVMGCIVNGIGEMADADFGYVGAAKGNISLYKGKVCIERNIPEAQAVEKLLKLIESNGYLSSN